MPVKFLVEKSEDEKVWVNAEMPKPLAIRVGKAAQNLGVSRSAIVRWALIDYLLKIEDDTTKPPFADK